MTGTAVVYKSAEDRTEEQAKCYLKTHLSPHRYLAYRDIHKFVSKYVKGKRALDFGTGTGASASFLYDLGFDVVGVDLSHIMLEIAKANFPKINFCHVNDLVPGAVFNLAFSSFVLLELSSKDEIIRYLNSCSSFMKKGGIFIGITGSDELYSQDRKWETFNTHFKENQNLQSGDVVKFALKHPKMEFYDYFWKESDLLEVFKETDLQVFKVYRPLGFLNDPYPWKDELFHSPFSIFLAKKK